jgi:hypothetical protein
MKTIIRKSIRVEGAGPLDNKQMPKKNLSQVAGRTLKVWFTCEGDSQESWIILRIPIGLDEEGVKNFIASECIK